MKNLIISLICVLSGSVAQAFVIEGVGLTLVQNQGLTSIVEVLPNTPAERAGIQKGEFITEINGTSALGLDLGDVVSQIRGPSGSLVDLTISDSQKQHERILHVIRAPINVECLMEGPYDMYLKNNVLEGNLGAETIQWNVLGTFVTGTYRGEPISLTLTNAGGELTLSGFIHSSELLWHGFQNHFFGEQECIQ